MTEQVVKLNLDYFDPEPNVPEPVLVNSEHVCYLIYNEWDGVRKALQFERCYIAKFGYPNDEALMAHPLYSKGLGFYGSYEVINSVWIKELRRNNKTTHPDRDIMLESRHFMFTFHDSTFECIANGVEPVDEYPKLDNSALKVCGM